ncbi:LEA type 2 family protein [Chitinibacter tainanensis]|uniref:LEA type 2 family protein n=1 Tax=Chitinibacter tainanensis TaxID=230667 RepID=UPI00235291E0|nr:LEA type 2 family protein [Chitinibacter tainanensis]
MMWARLVQKLLLYCCAVVLLSSCSVIPNGFEKPQVSLAGISVGKLGLVEQQFVLHLRVQNPNNYEIPLDGLQVKVALNGQHFAQGVTNEKLDLPRLGEKVVKLNVTTNLSGVFKQIQALQLGSAKLKYELTGKVYAPLLPGGLSFERTGELNILGN